jgi:hydrogenase maturation protease
MRSARGSTGSPRVGASHERVGVRSVLGKDIVDCKPNLVLGIGNLLLSDDGVGVHVVRELDRRILPADVEVLDGGTAGIELVLSCRARSRIVIVDAVTAHLPAGSVVKLRLADVAHSPEPPWSPHQTALPELLEAIRHLNPRPDVTIYGVVPRELALPGVDLSPDVDRQVPALADMILDDLASACQVASGPGMFRPSAR